MKNKLTIMLSAALGVVAIIAIAAPIGVGVTNSLKINNLQSELNQIREKTIGGLKPTQTLIDLVELSQTNRETQTTALSRLNAVENKSTLFTVVNENGNELANAITNDPIPNITGFQRSSDKKNWEFLVRVNWNLSQDYIIPHSFYNNGVPLVWGPAAQEEISSKDNFNEIINELDLSLVRLGATLVPTLKLILNTEDGKAKVAEALVNSDKITIENIDVKENSNSSGNIIGMIDIVISYLWKDNLDFFASSYTYTDFIIFRTMGELKDRDIVIPAIQAIDGVAEATNAEELETALNRNPAKQIIHAQIVFLPSWRINWTNLNIEVTGQPGDYTINIGLMFIANFEVPDLVINNFNINLFFK